MTDGGSTWQPPEAGGAPAAPPDGARGFAPPTVGRTAGTSPPARCRRPMAPVEADAARQRARRRARSSPPRSAPWPSSAPASSPSPASPATARRPAAPSSPEAAADAVLDALDNEDVLGAVDVLLPGERETFREPLQTLVVERSWLEWDVSSATTTSRASAASTSPSPTARSRSTPTNVDDIVNLDGVGDGRVDASTARTLPIGDLDPRADRRGRPGRARRAPGDRAGGRLVPGHRRRAGRPLVPQPLLHRRRAGAGRDRPRRPEPRASRPTAATAPRRRWTTSSTPPPSLDLTAMVASLNPNEFEALQRYAPLFLDDAQDELDAGIAEADVSIEVTDTAYDVTGSGDTRSVGVTALRRRDHRRGRDADRASFEDGCFVGTVPGETEDDQHAASCRSSSATSSTSTTSVDDPEAVEDAIADVQAAFDDYQNPGIIVKEVDGAWYVSPMATGSDQVLAVMRGAQPRGDRGPRRPVPRARRDDRGRGRRRSASTCPRSTTSSCRDRDDVAVPTTATADTVDAGRHDRPGRRRSATEETRSPDSTYVDEACYAARRRRAPGRASHGLVDGGDIDADDVPWYFRFPSAAPPTPIWDGDVLLAARRRVRRPGRGVAAVLQALIAAGEAEACEFDEVGQPRVPRGPQPVPRGGQHRGLRRLHRLRLRLTPPPRSRPAAVACAAVRTRTLLLLAVVCGLGDPRRRRRAAAARRRARTIRRGRGHRRAGARRRHGGHRRAVSASGRGACSSTSSSAASTTPTAPTASASSTPGGLLEPDADGRQPLRRHDDAASSRARSRSASPTTPARPACSSTSAATSGSAGRCRSSRTAAGGRRARGRGATVILQTAPPASSSVGARAVTE